MKNGPLFVEMHFYMRNGKSEDIEKFRKENKLKALGMPEFIASGSQDINELKHRYIVLPRFGRDIWKIFTDQGHIFPLHTVYRIGWQIVRQSSNLKSHLFKILFLILVERSRVHSQLHIRPW